jgi:cell cycle checkpoint protein
VSAQFEEFLGRGDRFGGLDLEDTAMTKEGRDAHPRSQRVLLIEELPTIFNRNSSGLAAFRASLQRYLAASTEQSLGGWMHPPIVMIVSETLLSSASSISDNLTVHRLLGPTLYNHVGTTIIDFNSIAPTFMQKALRLVLAKEAQTSRRSQVPGAAILDKIADIGDIRSALSALEFLCLKGDQAGIWSGSLSKTKKSRGGSTLTAMEQESLEMISQREASLGMFHAVGKIVYNKRLDPSLMPSDVPIPLSPPNHLSYQHRAKVSQVAVNELLDETGTDVSTFICALHENYPQSCDGDSFTDSFNRCIEALSDCDILSADRRPSHGARTGVGIGATPFNSGVDMLRQDEISFQVAARGLLFALPYPVNRRKAAVNGRKHVRDPYRMLYPASLRLWRRTEEIEGLVDSCMKQMLDPTGDSRLLARSSGATEESGVSNRGKTFDLDTRQ